MLHTILTRAAAGALALGLISPAAHAGGYGGGSPSSPIAPQQAAAFLAYADYYRDGNFSVRHTESAGAEAQTGRHGESASGYGSSQTDIEGASYSWKRSIQRSGSSATNGSASATGFTATFLKVRTADGRYYMFKGLASTGASAGPGGTSATQYGLARSASGRISR